MENILTSSYLRIRIKQKGGSMSKFVNYKKGALDSQPQMIKLSSFLPMVGGSFQVLRLLPPLKTGRHDIAESGIKHQKLINQSIKLSKFKKRYLFG